MTAYADLTAAAARLRTRVEPDLAADLAPLTARQLHAIADTLDESAAQMARKIGLAADLTASEGQVGSGRPQGADEAAEPVLPPCPREDCAAEGHHRHTFGVLDGRRWVTLCYTTREGKP